MDTITYREEIIGSEPFTWVCRTSEEEPKYCETAAVMVDDAVDEAASEQKILEAVANHRFHLGEFPPEQYNSSIINRFRI